MVPRPAPTTCMPGSPKQELCAQWAKRPCARLGYPWGTCLQTQSHPPSPWVCPPLGRGPAALRWPHCPPGLATAPGNPSCCLSFSELKGLRS